MIRAIAALAAVALLAPGTASAAGFIGVDGSLVWPQGAQTLSAANGWRARGRIGYETEGPVRFSFGFAADYTAFGEHPFSLPGSPAAARGLIGAGLSFGSFLAPGIYADAGLGGLRSGSSSIGNDWGPTWDAGIALDVVATTAFTIGAHLEYDWLAASQRLRWLAGGVHLRLGF